MLRYVFILLLIDTYGRGLGTPVRHNANGINLADSLEELAKYCQSPFLSAQIRRQLDNCNLPMQPPYMYKHFQCLFFYDINHQLCSATGSSKVAPNEAEYQAKLSEKLTTAEICNNISRSWDTHDLPNFPVYKETIPTILQNDFKCGQLCSNPDIFTDEVNFYCKYYKWGSDLLHPNAEAVQTVPNSNTAQEHSIDGSGTGLQHNLSLPEPVVPTVQKPAPEPAKLPEQPGNIKPVPSVDNIHLDKNEATLPESKVNIQQPVKGVDTLPESENHESLSNRQVSKPVSTQVVENKEQDNANEDIEIQQKAEINKVPPETVAATNEEVLNYNNNGEMEEEEPPKKGELEGEVGQEKISSIMPSEVKPPVIDTPEADAKQVAPQDPEDYQDTDDEKDDMEEGEAGEDGAAANAESKPQQQPKPADKRFRASVGDVSEQELFPPMEGFSEDESDSFFPLFLTAIILVVVLYVLYHNKTKVSKLVLGLIVEGRQSNRRRNSRGHNYRRLDTLEQAMGTHTAAAPSKIIY